VGTGFPKKIMLKQRDANKNNAPVLVHQSRASAANLTRKEKIMTALQRAPFSNSANVVDEMFTEARIDALNAKLIERGISADRVIAVLPVEAQIVANPKPPQFRVLYRTV
jgi:ribosomal protein L17